VSLDWRYRLHQWQSVLRAERGAGTKIPWSKMVRGILFPVPRAVWRARLRYGCYQCPIFDKERLACKSIHPQLKGLGCGCYVVFSALAPEPYEGGCWGRAKFKGDFGWGAYAFPSRLSKYTAFFRFLLRR
jgi:hypothetical protein